MRKKNWKKLLILNIPYLFIALFATKVGQTVRLAPGVDFSGKALHIMEGIRDAFASPMPSFHPADMCIGICIAAAMRLAVYIKGKNAKKFRHNREYGSARWGTADDIAPYVDDWKHHPVPEPVIGADRFHGVAVFVGFLPALGANQTRVLQILNGVALFQHGFFEAIPLIGRKPQTEGHDGFFRQPTI